MAEEPNLPEKPEEWQNFEKLAKGLFAVPKSELDAKIHKENKAARKRTEVRSTVPKK